MGWDGQCRYFVRRLSIIYAHVVLARKGRLEMEANKIYDNADLRCECWKCELNDRCVYKDKHQRISRDRYGGLGKCAKLPENKGKLQY